MPILAWKVPLMASVFFKRPLVLLILLFFSISLHSFKKVISSLLASLWNSAFSWVYLSSSPLFFTSLLSLVICKDSSDNHFAFLHFFDCLGWFRLLPPVHCKPMSMIFLAPCLPDLIPWIYHLHDTIINNFIYVIPEWPSGFPYFLQLKPGFCNQDLMIWTTGSLQVLFLLTI